MPAFLRDLLPRLVDSILYPGPSTQQTGAIKMVCLSAGNQYSGYAVSVQLHQGSRHELVKSMTLLLRYFFYVMTRILQALLCLLMNKSLI